MADIYSILAGNLGSEEDYLNRDPFFQSAVGLSKQQIAPTNSKEAWLVPLLQGLGVGALSGMGQKSANKSAYEDYRNSPLLSGLDEYQSETMPKDWTITQAKDTGILQALAGQQAQERALQELKLQQTMNTSLLKKGMQLDENGQLAPIAGYGDILAQNEQAKTLQKATLARQENVIKATPTLKLLDEVYDIAKGVSSVSGLNPWGTEKAKFDSARAAIMPSIQAMWKGPMSDSDLKRIQPLLPSIKDTKEQIEVKKQQMLDVVKSQSGIMEDNAITFEFGQPETQAVAPSVGLSDIDNMTPEQAQALLQQLGL